MSGAAEALLVLPAGDGGLHVVAIRGGRADDQAVIAGGAAAAGAVHRGRIARVVPGLRAAFVEIGLERPALLDVTGGPLEPGAAVTVQIIEPAAGDKAARVSRRVALAGRFVVALAGGRGVSWSKRGDAAKAQALAARIKPPVGAGFLLRRAAPDAPPEQVEAEAARLGAAAAAIAAAPDEPPLCLRPVDAVSAMLAEFAGAAPRRIVVGEARLGRTLAAALAREAPDLADRLEVGDEGPALLDRYGAAEALALAEQSQLALPSGGRLTIERTAALVAIDVDSGGAVDADALARTNLSAADEIGRQLRLRDLGGLIAVDFLRMEGPAAKLRPKVLARLGRATEADRRGVDVLGFTAGGLCELVRARTGGRGG